MSPPPSRPSLLPILITLLALVLFAFADPESNSSATTVSDRELIENDQKVEPDDVEETTKSAPETEEDPFERTEHDRYLQYLARRQHILSQLEDLDRRQRVNVSTNGEKEEPKGDTEEKTTEVAEENDVQSDLQPSLRGPYFPIRPPPPPPPPPPYQIGLPSPQYRYYPAPYSSPSYYSSPYSSPSYCCQQPTTGWGGMPSLGGGAGNLFNMGLGWGFNLGMPAIGTNVGLGTGLGVNVG